MPENTQQSNNGFLNSLGNIGYGAAATAANGVASSLVDMLFSGWRQRQQKTFQKALQEQQNALQLDYEKKHSETFSKSWERAQLEAAGLSPAIMYGGTGSSGSSGISSAKSPGISSPDLFEPSPVSQTPYGQVEIANSQARLNDAQAEYWENKAHTEEKMPDYYQAMTKLNQTLSEVENFLKDAKKRNLDADSHNKDMQSVSSGTLSDLQQSQKLINDLYYKGLTSSYGMDFFDHNGTRRRITTRGYMLDSLFKISQTVGNIINNGIIGKSSPTLIKQYKATLTSTFLNNQLLRDSHTYNEIYNGILKNTSNYKIWQEKYRYLNDKVNFQYDKWRNETAEGQRQYDNFISGANLVLDALGTAGDLYTGFGKVSLGRGQLSENIRHNKATEWNIEHFSKTKKGYVKYRE